MIFVAIALMVFAVSLIAVALIYGGGLPAGAIEPDGLDRLRNAYLANPDADTIDFMAAVAAFDPDKQPPPERDYRAEQLVEAKRKAAAQEGARAFLKRHTGPTNASAMKQNAEFDRQVLASLTESTQAGTVRKPYYLKEDPNADRNP